MGARWDSHDKVNVSYYIHSAISNEKGPNVPYFFYWINKCFYLSSLLRGRVGAWDNEGLRGVSEGSRLS